MIPDLYGAYRTLTCTEPQHMRPIVALLAERVRPGDRIYLYHFAVTPFRYYYPQGRSEWIGGVQSPPILPRTTGRSPMSSPGRAACGCCSRCARERV